MEISAKSLFTAVLRKWWILLICLIVGAVAGLFWGEVFTKDEYVSEVRISIQVQIDATDKESFNSDKSDVLTGCVNALKDRNFLLGHFQKNMKDDDTKPTLSQVDRSVEISLNGSDIYIRVTTGEPKLSYDIAASIASDAKGQIMKNTFIAPSIANVGQFSDATMPDSMKDKGTLTKCLLMGIVFAVLAAVVVIVVRLSDKRIYSPEELDQIYEIPVLGCVPDDEI